MTSIFSYSQDLTVNSIPISELDAQYIRVNAEVKLLRPFRASVFLDWGQISRIKELNKGWVLDENGKKFAFNGIMGAVNLLIENGCIVSLHDPYVTFWEEVEAEVNQDLYNLDKDIDIIIFSTRHSEYMGNKELIKHLSNLENLFIYDTIGVLDQDEINLLSEMHTIKVLGRGDI